MVRAGPPHLPSLIGLMWVGWLGGAGLRARCFVPAPERTCLDEGCPWERDAGAPSTSAAANVLRCAGLVGLDGAVSVLRGRGGSLCARCLPRAAAFCLLERDVLQHR